MLIILQIGRKNTKNKEHIRKEPIIISTTMAEVAEVKSCSNPGCDQPGISSCSACKTTFYCCVICQTADWTHHKEECSGHLRKVGKANLAKAEGFHQQQNWVQTLRYADLAATKLKQLKDRRLETVELISDALRIKFDALQLMGRHREALECIKECYTLWAMNYLRNPGSMDAALLLIESCIHNNEFEDAERYARHAYFMIAEMTDNFIPVDQQPRFLADISHYLAQSIFNLARTGGIPLEEKQKAGVEAIASSRKALELYTQLYGTNSAKVAGAMNTLADVLDYFNNVDDDEILRLIEQTIVFFSRVGGGSSANVAVGEHHLGIAYKNRARRADDVNDLDRCMVNLELALPHYREADRIYRELNQMAKADHALRNIVEIEAKMRQIGSTRAAAAAAAAAAATASRG